MSIELRNIVKNYGRQTALSGVSFSISAGQIAGFIGPNGAGKTTLMKILTGFIPPDSGEALVCGIDVTNDPVGVKRLTGYLPENNPLYPDMYISEYLEYVAGHYTSAELRGKDLKHWRKERISAVIELTGLGTESNKQIRSLSKGYRQRVGLAQAILHDPPVLILDEPTSGLDPNQIVEIRNLISSLGKEKTVLLSTHLMQEVEAICHRVIVIHKGMIQADGRPGEITGANSGTTVTIEIETDRKVDTSAILMMEGVLQLKELDGNLLYVEAKTDTDIRPMLFRHAVEQGYIVLSMQVKQKSMEEAFRELTK